MLYADGSVVQVDMILTLKRACHGPSNRQSVFGMDAVVDRSNGDAKGSGLRIDTEVAVDFGATAKAVVLKVPVPNADEIIIGIVDRDARHAPPPDFFGLTFDSKPTTAPSHKPHAYDVSGYRMNSALNRLCMQTSDAVAIEHALRGLNEVGRL